jgi:quinol-cytochrome oxidoreductase complex cytochrome b subunit
LHTTPCRKVSFRVFRTIVAVIAIISTITGLTVGYLTQGEAAFASSILMIPLSLIAVGVIAAKFGEKQAE